MVMFIDVLVKCFFIGLVLLLVCGVTVAVVEKLSKK